MLYESPTIDLLLFLMKNDLSLPTPTLTLKQLYQSNLTRGSTQNELDEQHNNITVLSHVYHKKLARNSFMVVLSEIRARD